LSDVFSLGTVAYFLLEGMAPFAAPTLIGSLTRTLAGELSPLAAEIPAPLRKLVEDCLAHDPFQRPPSMRELGERLKTVLAELPPFTHADAESWWREHPASDGQSLPEGSFSLILGDRTAGIAATQTLRRGA
jgi:serine/threonine protein kinase